MAAMTLVENDLWTKRTRRVDFKTQQQGLRSSDHFNLTECTIHKKVH